MNYRILIFVIILLLACGVKHQTLDQAPFKNLELTEDQEYVRWLFKARFFQSCLYLGFNPEDRKFLSNDISFESDFGLGTDWKIVDSLVSIQVGLIRQDSMHYFDNIKLKDEEYLGKKRVVQICLNGYESQKVDSIAIAFALKLTQSK